MRLSIHCSGCGIASFERMNPPKSAKKRLTSAPATLATAVLGRLAPIALATSDAETLVSTRHAANTYSTCSPTVLSPIQRYVTTANESGGSMRTSSRSHSTTAQKYAPSEYAPARRSCAYSA